MSHTPMQQVVGLPGQVVQGQLVQGQIVTGDQVTAGQMIMTTTTNLTALPQQQFVNQIVSAQPFQGNMVSNTVETSAAPQILNQTVTDINQMAVVNSSDSHILGGQQLAGISQGNVNQLGSANVNPSQAVKQPLVTQAVPPPSPVMSDHSSPIITKQRIADLVREVDPNEQLDDDVEDLLMLIGDDFIESITNSACKIAKHRGSRTLEVKDVQMYLERNWHMWIPGFGTEELKPYKRAPITEAHKQRLALLRKAVKKY